MKFSIDLIFVFIATILTLIFLRYESNYYKLIIKLFLYGLIITYPVIFFEKILLSFDFFPKVISELYRAFLVTGFLEEFFKRFVVISIAYKKVKYSEKYAGILFSVVVALGFATAENVLNVIFNYQTYQFGYLKTVITLLGHILYGITMGYYLSIAKFSITKFKNKQNFMLSLIVPVIFHGLYNFFFLMKSYLLLPLYCVLLLYIFFYNFKKLNTLYELKEINF